MNCDTVECAKTKETLACILTVCNRPLNWVVVHKSQAHSLNGYMYILEILVFIKKWICHFEAVYSTYQVLTYFLY